MSQQLFDATQSTAFRQGAHLLEPTPAKPAARALLEHELDIPLLQNVLASVKARLNISVVASKQDVVMVRHPSHADKFFVAEIWAFFEIDQIDLLALVSLWSLVSAGSHASTRTSVWSKQDAPELVALEDILVPVLWANRSDGHVIVLTPFEQSGFAPSDP